MTMIELGEDGVVLIEPPVMDPRWSDLTVDDGYVVDWQIDTDETPSDGMPPTG
jgi:hypothetical protein